MSDNNNSNGVHSDSDRRLKKKTKVEEEERDSPNNEENEVGQEKLEKISNDIEQLEKEFTTLKEEFFNNKIEDLKAEQETIQNESHQGYQRKLQQITVAKERRIKIAEFWKKYQMKNIEVVYQAEVNQANDDYNHERSHLKENMLSQNAEKKKKISEERSTSLNLSPERKPQRKRIPRDASVNTHKENIKINPPPIEYSLSDQDIQEDLEMIQKAIQCHPYWLRLSRDSQIANFMNRSDLNPDIFVTKGKLHYDTHVFEKGAEVQLQSGENFKWRGSLCLITPCEVQIMTTEGSKARFSLSHLRSKKISIRHV